MLASDLRSRSRTEKLAMRDRLMSSTASATAPRRGFMRARGWYVSMMAGIKKVLGDKAYDSDSFRELLRQDAQPWLSASLLSELLLSRSTVRSLPKGLTEEAPAASKDVEQVDEGCREAGAAGSHRHLQRLTT